MVSAGIAGTIYWCRNMAGGMVMSGGWTMSMAWVRLPGQSRMGAAAAFVGLWTFMMVTMMLPWLVPMLASYHRAVRGADGRQLVGTSLVGLGYISVWVVVGVLVYPVGTAAAAAATRWTAVAAAAPIAMGIGLVLAGCVQLTNWKARQLAQCRGALVHGGALTAGALNACRHGVRSGVRCALCCSGFVMILMVAGVMDLRIMAGIAAAITTERLARRPEPFTRAVGVFVLGAGVFVIAHAATAGGKLTFS